MASTMKEKLLVGYIDEKVNEMARPALEAVGAEIKKARDKFTAQGRREAFVKERNALRIECAKKLRALMNKHRVRDNYDREFAISYETLVSFNYADPDVLLDEKGLVDPLMEKREALLKKVESTKRDILVRMMLKGATMNDLEALLKEVKF